MVSHRLVFITHLAGDTFLPVIAEGGHTHGYLDLR